MLQPQIPPKEQTFFVLKIVTIAIILSEFLLFGATRIRMEKFSTPLEGESGSLFFTSHSFNDLFKPPYVYFAIAGIAFIFIARFLSKFLFKQMLLNNPHATQNQIYQFYSIPHILQLALYGVVGLLGFVIAFLSSNYLLQIPFGVAAIMNMVMIFPREGWIEALIDESGIRKQRRPL